MGLLNESWAALLFLFVADIGIAEECINPQTGY